jgi:multidrug efflux pump subunit AcrA (membrane-fusion protein)
MAGVVVLAVLAVRGGRAQPVATQPKPVSQPAAIASSTVRLSGTVEAVRARTVIVPRLAGQAVNALVITHLARAGSRVNVGDVLVEFDPQDQIRAAADRAAEVVDLDGQIQTKRSAQAVARAQDEADLAQAEHDVDRARFDTLDNKLLPRVEAEKNDLALEQATAQLAQLRETFALKRKAEDADLTILKIQRERSERARQYAEKNTTLMTVRAAFPGVVVIKSVFKGSGMGEVQEGDQVRAGVSFMQVVNPATMQVRIAANQQDFPALQSGQTAKVRLDAYPEMVFPAKVEQVSPIGEEGDFSNKLRNFTVLVSIQGNDPKLMPDLSAAVDVDLTTAKPAVGPAKAAVSSNAPARSGS